MTKKRGKGLRRGLALSLTALTALGLMAGCGSKEADGGDESTISIFLMKDDYKMYTSYNDNPIVQYLDEKFDVTLDFQQPAQGSETDQFNLMLGTGDFTDVMEISNYMDGTVQKLYEQDLIYDLAPYLDEYMPNYKKFLEEHEVYKEAYYTSDGKLFTIPMHLKDMDDYVEQWGGLVYRHDILEKMTNGNVAFPSGNEEPTTVDDWTYMMDLMKQYFEQQGLKDYACLIIPSTGYIQVGDITNGFGTYSSYFEKDQKVVYGPTTKEYYNYLKQMNEWYEAGYIYQDFASRTGDSFYTPNPSLVNSGAVGIWYGTLNQLEDGLAASGVEGADVRACSTPLDTKNGQDGTYSGINMLYGSTVSMDSSGYVVSTECSEEKLIKWLQICDFLFTEEGSMMASYGLDKEHGAAENEVYQKIGLEDGAWWYDENGNFVMNPVVDKTSEEYGGNEYYETITGYRLPGMRTYRYTLERMPQKDVKAAQTWGKYGFDNTIPLSVPKTIEETEELSNLSAQYATQLDTMTVKFIMGTEELNEETFQSFCDTLNSLGAERGTEIKQEQYDRWKAGESADQ